MDKGTSYLFSIRLIAFYFHKNEQRIGDGKMKKLLGTKPIGGEVNNERVR
ncbi:hypothetical protein AAHH17_02300 [Lysinibacillus capsici]